MSSATSDMVTAGVGGTMTVCGTSTGLRVGGAGNAVLIDVGPTKVTSERGRGDDSGGGAK